MSKENVCLTVNRMSCSHCEKQRQKKAVGALDGVDTVSVDLAGKKVCVEYDPARGKRRLDCGGNRRPGYKWSGKRFLRSYFWDRTCPTRTFPAFPDELLLVVGHAFKLRFHCIQPGSFPFVDDDWPSPTALRSSLTAARAAALERLNGVSSFMISLEMANTTSGRSTYAWGHTCCKPTGNRVPASSRPLIAGHHLPTEVFGIPGTEQRLFRTP